MAGTATHLHTVPTPAPAAVRRRGNHPAGRALVAAAERAAVGPAARPAARPVAGPVGRPALGPAVGPAASAAGSAPVVLLRPRLADVVPLPARRPDVRGSAGPAPLRLTRRGRRVVAGVGLGIVVALSAAAGAAVLGAGDGPALELAGRSTVVVHSGDTLWSIALSVAPDSDPREVVDALQEVNGLTDASLVPGQVLLLP